MSRLLDEVTQFVLNKNYFVGSSEYELQNLCDQYPYFSLSQLLLSEKSGNHENRNLFFTNPLWINHLLTTDHFHSTATKEPNVELSSQKNLAHFEEEKLADQEVVVATAIETNVEEISQTITTSLQVEATPATAIETDVEEILVANTASVQMEETTPPTTTEEKKPLPISTAALVTDALLEPYHTVDYFASQGIKFKDQPISNDKLGQQLKSFTEWLKTLKKKLPEENAVNPYLEQKVEKMAQTSIVQGEIVTEAMAEVWLKQGNKVASMAIYEKLSLLNPSKSAYFASLIEQLKNE